VVYSDVFRHSHYVALKVKDAIADHFRKHTSLRPSVDTRQPDIRVHIHIAGDRATLALDSSGDSLHKRGYRQAHGMASLNEVLAAGMIMRTGWDGTNCFMDPMCGSGTLLIEAAMIAKGIPPGYYRKRFLFQNWLDFDDTLFQKMRSGPSHAVSSPDIFGSDLSADQLKICRKNIERAGLSEAIRLKNLPFTEVRPVAASGIIMFNPPYGERLQNESLDALYRDIGAHLKHHFTGYKAWILSANQNALKHIGLRPAYKYDLYNGELKCRFNGYELYPGSLKSKA
jgi:putative N6-adenine-specific DNA methylase